MDEVVRSQLAEELYLKGKFDLQISTTSALHDNDDSFNFGTVAPGCEFPLPRLILVADV